MKNSKWMTTKEILKKSMAVILSLSMTLSSSSVSVLAENLANDDTGSYSVEAIDNDVLDAEYTDAEEDLSADISDEATEFEEDDSADESAEDVTENDGDNQDSQEDILSEDNEPETPAEEKVDDPELKDEDEDEEEHEAADLTQNKSLLGLSIGDAWYENAEDETVYVSQDGNVLNYREMDPSTVQTLGFFLYFKILSNNEELAVKATDYFYAGLPTDGMQIADASNVPFYIQIGEDEYDQVGTYDISSGMLKATFDEAIEEYAAGTTGEIQLTFLPTLTEEDVFENEITLPLQDGNAWSVLLPAWPQTEEIVEDDAEEVIVAEVAEADEVDRTPLQVLNLTADAAAMGSQEELNVSYIYSVKTNDTAINNWVTTYNRAHPSAQTNANAVKAAINNGLSALVGGEASTIKNTGKVSGTISDGSPWELNISLNALEFGTVVIPASELTGLCDISLSPDSDNNSKTQNIETRYNAKPTFVLSANPEAITDSWMGMVNPSDVRAQKVFIDNTGTRHDISSCSFIVEETVNGTTSTSQYGVRTSRISDTYYNLTPDTSNLLPSANAEGEEITYSIKETGVPADYVMEEETRTDANGNEFTRIKNITKSSIAINVTWSDDDDRKGYRPSGVNADEIVVYQHRVGAADEAISVTRWDGEGEEPQGPYILVDSDNNIVLNDGQFEIKNLKMMDKDANDVTYEYQYFITVSDDNLPANSSAPTTDYYRGGYDNADAFSSLYDGVYNGGTLDLTLAGQTKYEAVKQWQDEASNPNAPEDVRADVLANRPDALYTLWRYSKDYDEEGKENEGDYRDASQVFSVEGTPISAHLNTFDYIDDENQQQQITFDTTLEKYDNDGVELIYYSKERMLGANGYRAYYETQDPVVYEDGKIINRKTGNVTEKITKRWKGLSNGRFLENIKVEVTPLRRLKYSDDDSFKPVEDKAAIISGYMEEVRSITKNISLPQYDENGYEYEYKFEETGLLFGEEEITLSEAVEDEDGIIRKEFELNGESYASEYDPEKGEIVNRPLPQVKYVTEKVWYMEDETTPNTELMQTDGNSFTIQVYQNDEPMKGRIYVCTYKSGDDVTSVMYKDGNCGVAGCEYAGEQHAHVNGDFYEETAGSECKAASPHWHIEIDGLPMTDPSNGHDFKYYTVEKSSNPDGYHADGTITTNTKMSEENRVFGYTVISNFPATAGDEVNYAVTKYWNDPVSTDNRPSAVMMGVFAKGAHGNVKDGELLRTVIVDNGSNWSAEVEYSKATESQEFTYIDKDGNEQTKTTINRYTEGGEVKLFKTSDIEVREIALKSHGTWYPVSNVGSTQAMSGTDEDMMKAVENQSDLYESQKDEYIKTAAGNLIEAYAKIGVTLDPEKLVYTDEYFYYEDSRECPVGEKGSFNDKYTFQTTNTRLGVTNVFVKKTWMDGNNTSLTEKPTLTLKTNAPLEDAETSIEMSRNDQQVEGEEYIIYGFTNLPKYDMEGVLYDYSVEEILTDEMKAAHYQSAIEVEKSYTPNPLRTDSYEVYACRNYLEDRENVTFYKQWVDAYRNELDRRPDLYLDLFYQVEGDDNYYLVNNNGYWEFEWNTYENAVAPADENAAINASNISSYLKQAQSLNALERYVQYGDGDAYYKKTYNDAIKAGKTEKEATKEANSVVGKKVSYFVRERTSRSTAYRNQGDYASYYMTSGYDVDWLEDYSADSNFSVKVTGRGHYASDEGEGDLEPLHRDAKPYTEPVFCEENGWIVNALEDTIKVNAHKIFNNVPSGFNTELVDFSGISLNLTQYYSELDGNNVVPTEKTENNDPDKGLYSWTKGNTLFTYNKNKKQWELKWFEKSGENNTGDKELPEYDQYGMKYTYVLGEEGIDSRVEADKLVSDSEANGLVDNKVNGFAMENTYRPDVPKGSLTIKKNWVDQLGNEIKNIDWKDKNKRPTVTYYLYRTAKGYHENEAAPAPSDDSSIWFYMNDRTVELSDDMKVNFDNLEVYTPDGNYFYYYVKEVVTNIDSKIVFEAAWTPDGWIQTGSKTPANGTEFKQGVENDKMPGTFIIEQPSTATTLKPYQDGNDKKYDYESLNTNKYDPQVVSLEGTKTWFDGGYTGRLSADAFKPYLRLYRWYRGQSEANATRLTVDKDYTLTVTKTDDNVYTYKFENLQKYAPNGRLWIYQIREVVPPNYRGDGANSRTQSIQPGQECKTILSTDKKLTVSDDGSEIKGFELSNILRINLKVAKTWLPEGSNFFGTDKHPKMTYTLYRSLDKNGPYVKQNSVYTYQITNAINPENILFKGWSAYDTDGSGKPYYFYIEEKIEGLEGDGVYTAGWSGGDGAWSQTTPSAVGSYTGETNKTIIIKSEPVSYEDFKPSDTLTFITGNTNSFHEGKVGISGTKTWDDNNNEFNTRTAVTEYVKNLVVQRRYANVNGVSGNNADRNWHTVLSGTTDADRFTVKVDSADSNKYTYAVENLPLYDSNGKKFIYRFKETVPEGYSVNRTNGETIASIEKTATVTGTDDDLKVTGLDLTNTLNGQITVEKKWFGDATYVTKDQLDYVREKTVEVQLQYLDKADNTWKPATYFDETKVKEASKGWVTDTQTLTYFANNAWTNTKSYTFKKLPIKMGVSQEPVQYRVVEKDVNGNWVEATSVAFGDKKHVVTYDSLDKTLTAKAPTAKINVSNTLITAPVQLKKTDDFTTDIVSGVKFTITLVKDQDGAAYSGNVKFEGTTNANGVMVYNNGITMNLAPGTYTIAEAKGSASANVPGYKAKTGTITVTAAANGKSAKAEVKWGTAESQDTVTPSGNVYTLENTPISGEIGFYKSAENSIMLEGAEFTLTPYKDDLKTAVAGKDTLTKESGENGLVYFDKVVFTNYLLKETKVPDGYKQPYVSIDGGKTYKKFTAEGVMISKAMLLNVIKPDAKEFKVQISFTEKSNNHYVLNLKSVDTFAASESVINTPITVNIQKYGVDTTVTPNAKEKLKGAKFSIYSTADETTPYVTKEVTDKEGTHPSQTLKDIEVSEDGSLKLYGVEGGYYKIVETFAPDGYLNAADVYFAVTSDGTVKYGTAQDKCSADGNKEIPVNDAKAFAPISILKTSSAASEAVNGAVFDLYTADGTKIAGGLKTDKDGKWTSVNNNATYKIGQTTRAFKFGLPVGDYYFVETDATADYYLDPSKTVQYKFSIKVDNTKADKAYTVGDDSQDRPGNYRFETAANVGQLDITNTPFEANGTFEKIDSASKEKIRSATFKIQIQDAADASKWNDVEELTTNSAGKVNFNITKKGTYRILETANDGYFNNDAATPAEEKIDEEKVMATFTAADANYKGKVALQLKDESGKDITGNTLSNNRKTTTVILNKADKDNNNAPLNNVEFTLQYKAANASDYEDVKVNGTVVKVLTGNTYKLESTDAASAGIPTEADLADLSKFKLTEKAGTKGQLEVVGLPWISANASYRLIETKSADGYVLDSALVYEFKFNRNTLKQVKAEAITNIQNKIEVTKTYKAQGAAKEAEWKAIVGTDSAKWAEFTLVPADETKDSIKLETTDGIKYTAAKIPAGEYTLKETKVPSGFTAAEDVEIKVTEDGKIVANPDSEEEITLCELGQAQTLSMNELPVNNTPQKVKVSATKTFNYKVSADGKVNKVQITLSAKVDGTELDLAEMKDVTGNAIPETKVITAKVSGVSAAGSVTWNNLPRYADGKEITWSTTETPIDGYKAEKTAGTPQENNGDVEIADSYVNTENRLVVNKKFFDRDEEDQKVDSSKFAFSLMKDGKAVVTSWVDADGQAVFTGIADGTYTLVESNYDSTTYMKWDGSATVEVKDAVIKVTKDDADTEITVDENNNVDVAVTVNNYRLGHFKFTKKDNNDKPLAGVEFTLKGGKPESTATAVSGKDGVVSFENIKPGTYELTESKALAGYAKPEAGMKVRVDEKGIVYYTNTSGTEVQVTDDASVEAIETYFINKPIQLLVEKRDDQGNMLAGAELTLTITSGADTLETALTTDAQKKAIKGKSYAWTTGEDAEDLTGLLSAGCAYTITETDIPGGYARAVDVTVTIDENGTITVKTEDPNKTSDDTILITMVDTKEFEAISLKKIDLDGKYIPNVKFDMYVDADGDLSTTDDQFKMNKDDEPLVTNTQGIWSSSSSSASYTIKKKDGTTESGEFKDGLPEGTYFFVETDATDKYYLDSATKYPFIVSIDQTTRKVQIEGVTDGIVNYSFSNGQAEINNTPFTAKVEFQKKDSADNQPIENAKFTIERYDAETDSWKSVADSLTTGKDGKVAYTVDAKGKYRIVETENKGYYNTEDAANQSIDASKVMAAFEATNADQNGNLKLMGPDGSELTGNTLSNDRKTTSVSLEKIDKLTKDRLDNVEFTLYYKAADSEEQEIAKFRTGSDYTYSANDDTVNKTPTEADLPEMANYTAAAEKGDTGVLTIKGLPWLSDGASYRLVETRSIDGYILDRNAQYEFTFNRDQQIQVGDTAITNPQNAIKINKSYKADGAAQNSDNAQISGADTWPTFTLVPTDAKASEIKLSTEDGNTYTASMIPNGTYNLTETVTTGYKQAAPISVTVTDGTITAVINGKTITLCELGQARDAEVTAAEINNVPDKVTVTAEKTFKYQETTAGKAFKVNITLSAEADGQKLDLNTLKDVTGTAIKEQNLTQTVTTTGTGLEKTGKAEWINLPKYYNGKLITWSTTETPVAGYVELKTEGEPEEVAGSRGDMKLTDKYQNIESGFGFNKIDAEDNTPLAGVKFELTPESGNPITVVSDANGRVEFSELKPGNYTLKEKETLPGYLLSGRELYVNIDANGKEHIRESKTSTEDMSEEDISFKLVNYKNRLELYKTYEKSDRAEISGDDIPVFTLVAEEGSGNEDIELTPVTLSGMTGRFYRATAIPDGDYTLTESESIGYDTTVSGNIQIPVYVENGKVSVVIDGEERVRCELDKRDDYNLSVTIQRVNNIPLETKVTAEKTFNYKETADGKLNKVTIELHAAADGQELTLGDADGAVKDVNGNAIPVSKEISTNVDKDNLTATTAETGKAVWEHLPQYYQGKKITWSTSEQFEEGFYRERTEETKAQKQDDKDDLEIVEASYTNTENELIVSKKFWDYAETGTSAEAGETKADTMPVFTLTPESSDEGAEATPISAAVQADGRATFTGIADGTYTLTETSSDPKFYQWTGSAAVVVEGAEITVTINDSDPENMAADIALDDDDVLEVTATVDNFYKGHFAFTKLEETPEIEGISIEGTEFTLTPSEEGDPIVKAADENGLVSFTDLETGTYTLEETKQMPGHEIVSVKVTVEVQDTIVDDTHHMGRVVFYDESGKEMTKVEVETAFTNPFNKLQLAKTVEGETPVTNATFVITGKFADGTTEQTLTTTISDNKAVTEILTGLLVPGETYKVAETTAPEGYTLAPEFEFTIDKFGVVSLTDDSSELDEITLDAKTADIAEINVITVDDKPINVSLLKQDVDGNKLTLTDATFKITGKFADLGDATVEPPYEVTTDDGVIELNGILIAGETYEVEETVAPEGYTLAPKFSFKVDAHGDVEVIGDEDVQSVVKAEQQMTESEDQISLISVTDKQIKVRLKKLIDHEFKSEATFDIIGKFADLGDETVESPYTVITDKGVIELIGILVAGETYTVIETKAPEGYTLAPNFSFELDANGDVTIIGDEKVQSVIKATQQTTDKDADEPEISIIEVTDKQIDVNLEKFDLGDTVLKEATFEVTGRYADEEKASTKTITTEDGIVRISDVVAGETYKVDEIIAPEGYRLADTFYFKVLDDGDVQIVDSSAFGSSNENSDEDPGQLVNERVDVSEDEPTNEGDSTSEGDSSDEEPTEHDLVEVLLQTTESDAERSIIAVSDKQIKVQLKKTDMSGKALANTEFVITGHFADDMEVEMPLVTDADGIVELDGVLVAGQTYTVEETKATEGYTVAPSFEFTIDEHGDIKDGIIIGDASVREVVKVAQQTTEHESEISIVSVSDKLIKAKLEKRDLDGAILKEATFEITGRFFDEAAGTTAESTKTLTTAGGVLDMDGLIADETYTVKETKAPEGYKLVDEFKFTVDKHGDLTITGDDSEDDSQNTYGASVTQQTSTSESEISIVTVKDPIIEAKLVKQDLKGNALAEAEFEIKGRFADEASETTKTFTADSEGNIDLTGILAADESYSITETKAPSGYLKIKDTLKVTMNNDGTLSVDSGTVSDGTGFYVDEDTAVITAKDQKAPGGGNENKKNPVKTGDDTPYEAYGMVMALALSGIVSVLYKKKKRSAK